MLLAITDVQSMLRRVAQELNYYVNDIHDRGYKIARLEGTFKHHAMQVSHLHTQVSLAKELQMSEATWLRHRLEDLCNMQKESHRLNIVVCLGRPAVSLHVGSLLVIPVCAIEPPTCRQRCGATEGLPLAVNTYWLCRHAPHPALCAQESAGSHQ